MSGSLYIPLISELPPPLNVLSALAHNREHIAPLGTTEQLGRPAWLLSVDVAEGTYLVWIDQETYALLDVQLLPPQSEAGAEARHVWRARTFELLEHVEASVFQLGGADWGEPIRLPPSLRGDPFDGASAPITPEQRDLLLAPAAWPLPQCVVLLSGSPERIMSIIRSEYGVVMALQDTAEGEVISRPESGLETVAGRRFAFVRLEEYQKMPVTFVWFDTSSLLPEQSDVEYLFGLAQPLLTADQQQALAREIASSIELASPERQHAFIEVGE